MNEYLAQSVSTASPAQLILMLFDGALARIQRAERALAGGAPGDALAATRDLTRAQAIVTELQVSLDHARGGELAANLEALYVWCLEQLLAANRGRDASLLAPVAKVLRELRDAWAEACCTGPHVPTGRSA